MVVYTKKKETKRKVCYYSLFYVPSFSLSLSRVSSDDTTQSRQAINLESYSYIMSLSYVHKLIFYSLYCL